MRVLALFASSGRRCGQAQPAADLDPVLHVAMHQMAADVDQSPAAHRALVPAVEEIVAAARQVVRRGSPAGRGSA